MENGAKVIIIYYSAKFPLENYQLLTKLFTRLTRKNRRKVFCRPGHFPVIDRTEMSGNTGVS
ncbi:hypothetical protein HMPREF9141_1010, partial [Prevotella multiformis DSM 16608]